MIPPRDLETNDLDKQADGQQSDPIRDPFLPFEARNSKKIN